MDSSETNDPLNNPTATETSSATETSGQPDVAEQLAAARQEATANHDRYLRSVADLENFRRRTVREKDELRQFAASRVLEDLLPVLDNLGLGLSAARQPGADLKTLTDGIEMVLTQLKTALANHGLKEINPAGEAFDANLHESISAQPSEKIPEGNVATVVRPGFSLNGRLLRPASVVLSSGSAKEGKK
jgi:molecular chaperone GrpE